MPASNKVMIHKLQTAINTHGGCLLLDKIQFYSEEQDRPISLYKISTPGGYTKSGKRKKDVLFQTPSQIQVVLFLRDYWFSMIGKELPTENEIWEEIKEKNSLNLLFENIKIAKEE